MTEQTEFRPELSEQENVAADKAPFIDRRAIHPLLFALLSLVFIFILYQIGSGFLMLIFVGSVSITRENVWIMRWLTLFGQLCFILIPTFLLARLSSVRLKEVFPFRVPGLRESTFALIALFSLQRVFEGYIFFQQQIPMPELMREFVEPLKKMFEELVKVLIRADSPLELFAVVFVVAVVPSVVEELLFRGFIQKTFERLMSPVVAAVLAGTIFGLYHVNPFELIPLIGLGVFFGLLRYRSQSLWLPISAHFFNNFMAVLAAYYGIQDDKVVGISQSPDVPTMFFLLIVFISLFFLSFVAYLRITHDVSRQVR